MMRTTVFVCLALGALAKQPARPKISANYHATGRITVFKFETGSVILGRGGRALWNDAPGGARFADWMQFEEDGKEFNLHDIVRWDKGMRYAINLDNRTQCWERRIHLGEWFPHSWQWVAGAQYVGDRTIDHQDANVWEARERSRHLHREVAVYAMNPNVPIYTAANNITSGNLQQHFWSSFVPGIPDENLFVVPSSCEPETPQNHPGLYFNLEFRR
mmetsp:Transcript_19431/g.21731  ORF Transcript_19431/g.21731 Transcript_19431/m.21731 type:complete len:217 (+) Transcript_19431:21-671(+)